MRTGLVGLSGNASRIIVRIGDVTGSNLGCDARCSDRGRLVYRQSA